MNSTATGEDLKVCRTADDQWKLTSSEEHSPSASYCTANQVLTRSSVEDKLNMMAVKYEERLGQATIASCVVDCGRRRNEATI